MPTLEQERKAREALVKGRWIGALNAERLIRVAHDLGLRVDLVGVTVDIQLQLIRVIRRRRQWLVQRRLLVVKKEAVDGMGAKHWLWLGRQPELR